MATTTKSDQKAVAIEQRPALQFANADFPELRVICFRTDSKEEDESVTTHMNEVLRPKGVPEWILDAGADTSDLVELVRDCGEPDHGIIAVAVPGADTEEGDFPDGVMSRDEVWDVMTDRTSTVDGESREVQTVDVQEFTVYVYDNDGKSSASGRVIREVEDTLSARGNEWKQWLRMGDPVMEAFEAVANANIEEWATGHTWVVCKESRVMWAYDRNRKVFVTRSAFVKEMIMRHFPWDRDSTESEWRAFFELPAAASLGEGEQKKMPMAEFRRRFESEIAKAYHGPSGVNCARVEVMFDPDDVPGGDEDDEAGS